MEIGNAKSNLIGVGHLVYKHGIWKCQKQPHWGRESIFVLICTIATPVDRPQLGYVAKHANGHLSRSLKLINMENGNTKSNLFGVVGDLVYKHGNRKC